MIKAIMFDLDDTILWDRKSIADAFAATCRFAAQKYKVDPQELEKAVRTRAKELYETYEFYPFTQQIGINPFEGLWGLFPEQYGEFPKMHKTVPSYRKEAWTNGLRAVGIDDTTLGAELAELFPLERQKRPHLYEDSIHVLEQLKGKYKLLLLTNGSPELQQTKLTISPEIAPFFDYIVVSGSIGHGKPALAIFDHALKKLGIEKDEVLMVGDNLLTDILGAVRAGIASVWVNRDQKNWVDVEPNYEINELRELLPLLEQLNK